MTKTTTKCTCTELASALFTTSLTATELVISPWTMAMLESDMVKNEECRTVLLIVYAVFKSLAFWDPHITRKLSYHKDDRAMHLRPIWCPENFREPLSMCKATFPVILMGFCCDLSCDYKI